MKRGRQTLIQNPCTSCKRPVWRVNTPSKLNRRCRTCASKEFIKPLVGKKGSANSNWKGGKTSEIQKFYNSSEWKELRSRVFIRDNYTCRDCPQRGGQLEANHIKARSRFPELSLCIDNIETLCKSCHDKKKWQVYV